MFYINTMYREPLLVPYIVATLRALATDALYAIPFPIFRKKFQKKKS
jgi:hypothetical protein